MAFSRLNALRNAHKTVNLCKTLTFQPPYSPLNGSHGSFLIKGTRFCRGVDHLNATSETTSYGIGYRSIGSPSFNLFNGFSRSLENAKLLHSAVVGDLLDTVNHKGFSTVQAKAPPQARQTGALKVSIVSPGFIYEPYERREPISFWRRWFTRRGWKRTKEDMFLELKSAYAVAKLRKLKGYSKQQFYNEAIQLYKEINTLMAKGDKTLLRKFVTENMYSILKNEIKQRESMWSSVYWEMIGPAVKVRTLRARMKFAAYDSKGTLISGDKTKEVLVRDIWVFERSLFHSGAYWRLCGRIAV
ncbi:uncharacterized protein LOC18440635 isoform X2 [Amborella trichopoda]|uniref:uncharacterized protein LOC18440635 isoform X2 n=1 Tax=Amborella trichopoda TaxID=13333 RepID=UPI0009C06514|nr:uncharacterized protein LOC18440635 isoform X2 [Amborella trichopoda]|eukprot:XP_020527109.1 uncharacterized protein LOC18440635 isoform X2 [Amborella trichopoda]